MRLLICCLILSMSVSAFGQKRQDPTRNQTRNAISESSNQARSTTEPAPQQQNQQVQAQTNSSTCPNSSQITSILDSYCATSVCSNSDEMLQVLNSSGVSISNLSCRGLAFEEIAGRLSTNYMSMKMSCDSMKKKSDDAISDWSTKYAELDAQKDKAEKSKKGATAAAIALGATTLASGIGNIVQAKNIKDERKVNKNTADLTNEEIKALTGANKEKQKEVEAAKKKTEEVETQNKLLEEQVKCASSSVWDSNKNTCTSPQG